MGKQVNAERNALPRGWKPWNPQAVSANKSECIDMKATVVCTCAALEWPSSLSSDMRCSHCTPHCGPGSDTPSKNAHEDTTHPLEHHSQPNEQGNEPHHHSLCSTLHQCMDPLTHKTHKISRQENASLQHRLQRLDFPRRVFAIHHPIERL